MADQKASADTAITSMLGSEKFLALDATPTNRTIAANVLSYYIGYSISQTDISPRTLLFASPTNATLTTLTQAGAAYTGGGDVIYVPPGQLIAFSGYVLAKKAAGGSPRSMWKVEGLVTCTTAAADTAFVGTPTVTMLFQDAGASGWTVACAVDTAIGNLKINVTGDAGFTTNWKSVITTVALS
jgi:hypothetical protein